MSRKKKNKIRTIDGKAIYKAPGTYELHDPIPNPFVFRGYWPANTRFVVERHVDKIGDQNAYEHYSIRLDTHDRPIVKSYQHEKWNYLVTRLTPL